MNNENELSPLKSPKPSPITPRPNNVLKEINTGALQNATSKRENYRSSRRPLSATSSSGDEVSLNVNWDTPQKPASMDHIIRLFKKINIASPQKIKEVEPVEEFEDASEQHPPLEEVNATIDLEESLSEEVFDPLKLEQEISFSNKTPLKIDLAPVTEESDLESSNYPDSLERVDLIEHETTVNLEAPKELSLDPLRDDFDISIKFRDALERVDLLEDEPNLTVDLDQTLSEDVDPLSTEGNRSYQLEETFNVTEDPVELNNLNATRDVTIQPDKTFNATELLENTMGIDITILPEVLEKEDRLLDETYDYNPVITNINPENPDRSPMLSDCESGNQTIFFDAENSLKFNESTSSEPLEKTQIFAENSVTSSEDAICTITLNDVHNPANETNIKEAPNNSTFGLNDSSININNATDVTAAISELEKSTSLLESTQIVVENSTVSENFNENFVNNNIFNSTQIHEIPSTPKGDYTEQSTVLDKNQMVVENSFLSSENANSTISENFNGNFVRNNIFNSTQIHEIPSTPKTLLNESSIKKIDSCHKDNSSRYDESTSLEPLETARFLSENSITPSETTDSGVIMSGSIIYNSTTINEDRSTPTLQPKIEERGGDVTFETGTPLIPNETDIREGENNLKLHEKASSTMIFENINDTMEVTMSGGNIFNSTKIIKTPCILKYVADASQKVLLEKTQILTENSFVSSESTDFITSLEKVNLNDNGEETLSGGHIFNSTKIFENPSTPKVTKEENSPELLEKTQIVKENNFGSSESADSSNSGGGDNFNSTKVIETPSTPKYIENVWNEIAASKEVTSVEEFEKTQILTENSFVSWEPTDLITSLEKVNLKDNEEETFSGGHIFNSTKIFENPSTPMVTKEENSSELLEKTQIVKENNSGSSESADSSNSGGGNTFNSTQVIETSSTLKYSENVLNEIDASKEITSIKEFEKTQILTENSFVSSKPTDFITSLEKVNLTNNREETMSGGNIFNSTKIIETPNTPKYPVDEMKILNEENSLEVLEKTQIFKENNFVASEPVDSINSVGGDTFNSTIVIESIPKHPENVLNKIDASMEVTSVEEFEKTRTLTENSLEKVNNENSESPDTILNSTKTLNMSRSNIEDQVVDVTLGVESCSISTEPGNPTVEEVVDVTLGVESCSISTEPGNPTVEEVNPLSSYEKVEEKTLTTNTAEVPSEDPSTTISKLEDPNSAMDSIINSPIKIRDQNSPKQNETSMASVEVVTSVESTNTPKTSPETIFEEIVKNLNTSDFSTEIQFSEKNESSTLPIVTPVYFIPTKPDTPEKITENSKSSIITPIEIAAEGSLSKPTLPSETSTEGKAITSDVIEQISKEVNPGSLGNSTPISTNKSNVSGGIAVVMTHQESLSEPTLPFETSTEGETIPVDVIEQISKDVNPGSLGNSTPISINKSNESGITEIPFNLPKGTSFTPTGRFENKFISADCFNFDSPKSFGQFTNTGPRESVLSLFDPLREKLEPKKKNFQPMKISEDCENLIDVSPNTTTQPMETVSDFSQNTSSSNIVDPFLSPKISENSVIPSKTPDRKFESNLVGNTSKVTESLIDISRKTPTCEILANSTIPINSPDPFLSPKVSENLMNISSKTRDQKFESNLVGNSPKITESLIDISRITPSREIPANSTIPLNSPKVKSLVDTSRNTPNREFPDNSINPVNSTKIESLINISPQFPGISNIPINSPKIDNLIDISRSTPTRETERRNSTKLIENDISRHSPNRQFLGNSTIPVNSPKVTDNKEWLGNSQTPIESPKFIEKFIDNSRKTPIRELSDNSPIISPKVTSVLVDTPNKEYAPNTRYTPNRELPANSTLINSPKVIETLIDIPRNSLNLIGITPNLPDSSIAPVNPVEKLIVIPPTEIPLEFPNTYTTPIKTGESNSPAISTLVNLSPERLRVPAVARQLLSQLDQALKNGEPTDELLTQLEDELYKLHYAELAAKDKAKFMKIVKDQDILVSMTLPARLNELEAEWNAMVEESKITTNEVYEVKENLQKCMDAFSNVTSKYEHAKLHIYSAKYAEDTLREKVQRQKEEAEKIQNEMDALKTESEKLIKEYNGQYWKTKHDMEAEKVKFSTQVRRLELTEASLTVELNRQIQTSEKLNAIIDELASKH